jgi:hypothetical protein
MRIFTTALVAIILATNTANSSELLFQFNSPAFSGQGYSTHVLTIEQLEQQRKDRIKSDEQAAIDRAERDIRNTNAYKFQNNLESRIYAQLSRQIADQIFGETDNNNDSGKLETPFGDTIIWSRENDQISISVSNSNGDLISEFTVPVGEFAF